MQYSKCKVNSSRVQTVPKKKKQRVVWPPVKPGNRFSFGVDDVDKNPFVLNVLSNGDIECECTKTFDPRVNAENLRSHVRASFHAIYSHN